MAAAGRDPYRTLGVGPAASDEELRVAYRRLVQRHHPDHNHGSPESARRFEEIQEAYAQIRQQRGRSARRADERPRANADPGVEARLADIEQQLRQARDARERAQRAAREAATAAADERPSDEELGYVKTDDTFAKWLEDARAELADWLRRD